MKHFLFSILCLLSIHLKSQVIKNDFTLVVKRPIWFYDEKKMNRVTLPENTTITYKIIEGEEYYPAMMGNTKGFVEAEHVSLQFQSRNKPKTTFRTYKEDVPKEIDPNTILLHEAGEKISSGANTYIAGTVIAILGAAAGIIIAKEKPDLGYGIVAGSGAIGLALNIGGIATIASGGKKLKDFKAPIEIKE